MELVFTRDIPRTNGDQWSVGQIVDYPRATWDAIAKSLGKKLNTFTRALIEGLLTCTTGEHLTVDAGCVPRDL